MKRLYLILVVFLILILFVGCGRNSTNQPAEPASAGNSQAVVSSNAESVAASEGRGAQIIAKSGSNVSSKDKEAILNEISKELDTMLQNINNMEDISDEDLKL